MLLPAVLQAAAVRLMLPRPVQILGDQRSPLPSARVLPSSRCSRSEAVHHELAALATAHAAVLVPGDLAGWYVQLGHALKMRHGALQSIAVPPC